MRCVNLATVKWDEWKSPAGKFHGYGQQVSIALGAVPNARLHAGGHPFDLEVGRLPPGRAGCPFHSHATQWELFLITAGSGQVRHGDALLEVYPGMAILHPPGGEAHQLLNTGATDLTYYLVADNPATDIWHYPDSDKWGFKPPGRIFRLNDAPYYEGEEPGDHRLRPPRPAEPQPATRWVDCKSLPWEQRISPKGRYESFCRDISLALGGVPNGGVEQGGHPFDLQFRRVPPGKAICPYHAHSRQWELFIIESGEARVRSGGAIYDVGTGDVFLQPPGAPHQLTNTGAEDLVCLIIADNPPAESTYYPDSDKWMIKPPRKVVRVVEVDYFDGEE